MADLTRLSGGTFVIIGRAGMDFYADPPGARTEEAARFTACLGGSSANIGVALVKLGLSAALVTCVADDSIGRFCLNELDRYGIDRTMVRTVGGEARNSLAVIETRIEDHQSVIYRNGAADFEMGADDVAAIGYARYSGLITTGTVLARDPSRSATLAAFAAARADGLPLIFDVDYRPYSWTTATEAAAVLSDAARQSDVVIGNDVEFGVMSGDIDTGLALARDLAADGSRIVVYKRGEHGAITFADGAEVRTGIYPTTPLKPTGAGDSFMGGFIAALSRGMDVRTAVLRGSAAAAIVVGRVGCAPAMPTAAEIDAKMAEGPAAPAPTDP